MRFLNIILVLIALFMFALLVITVINNRKKVNIANENYGDDEDDEPVFNTSKLKAFVLDLDGNIYDFAEIPPSEDAFVIGSSPEKTDLRVVEQGVSKTHLHVYAGGSPEYVWDNNSKYGTFHNGEKVKKVYVEEMILVWLAQTPVVIARKGENVAPESVKDFYLKEKSEHGIPEIQEN